MSDHTLPPIDDESYESWMQSIMDHPILGHEYLCMQQAHQALPALNAGRIEDDERFGGVYQDIYGWSRCSSVTLGWLFRGKAARLQEADRALVNEFARHMSGRLESESRVWNASNPARLLQHAFKTTGDDILSRKRRVEAIPRYIMSRLLFEIDQTESEVDVSDQADDILQEFMARMFTDRKSKVIHFYPFLNEGNHYLANRDLAWNVGEEPQPPDNVLLGHVSEHVPTNCRFLEDDQGEMPGILHDRVKGDFSSGLKMLRKGTRHQDEFDKRALTIVVMNEDHLRRVDALFRAAMVNEPFSIHNRQDYYDPEVSKKRRNPDSSMDYLAIRYILMYWDERKGKTVPVEANIQLVADHANTKYSRCDARHTWYRFKQLCRSYFPFRYPRFVFGVDFRAGSSDYNKMLSDLV